MKNRHIQYILLLVVFTVVMDFAFGKLYEGLYFSEESRQNDRLIHSVLGTHEDILIFGSSRALHHYNPKVIEDSLGMSCYNVGAGGQNIYYHLALLKSTLEHYTPKIVILELMSIDFEITPSQWDKEKLGTLLPFYHKSEAAKVAVLRRGNFEQFKNISQIYGFNSLQYNIMRNNFCPTNNDIQGFVPILGRVWNRSIESKPCTLGAFDDSKISALNEFINTCIKNNIKGFVFISPIFVDNLGNSCFTKILYPC